MKWIKNKHKKWEHPFIWLVIGDGNFTLVHNVSTKPSLALDRNRANVAMTTQQEENKYR